MSMQNENIKLHLNLDYYKESSTKPHLLFLHGFTGSSQDWMNIIPQIDESFSKIAIDIIGHGNSPSPEESEYYTARSIAKQVDDSIKHLGTNKIVLVGYSMGGRAALNYTFAYPGKVAGLILESTTAGIESESEKIDRIENDKKLANNILKEGLDRFIDYWMNIPLFFSQKRLNDSDLENIRQNKLKHSPYGLANSLLGFGTGEMPSYWESLPELNIPVLLITGELDEKYKNINERMKSLLPDADHSFVNDAGHNVHLEKPSEFIILVNSFLRTKFN